MEEQGGREDLSLFSPQDFTNPKITNFEATLSIDKDVGSL